MYMEEIESRYLGTSSILYHSDWMDSAASPFFRSNMTFFDVFESYPCSKHISSCTFTAVQLYVVHLIRAHVTDLLYNLGSMNPKLGFMNTPHLLNFSPIAKHLGLLNT